MLKYNIANPLAVFGLQRVTHILPHFTKCVFQLSYSEKRISDWLYENVEGRFFAGYIVISNERQYCVAFEEPIEATMFAMQRDQIDSPSVYK